MSQYTTADLISYEIRAASTFSATTLPSLSTITTWIEEESDYIDTELGNTANSQTVATAYIDYEGDDILLLRNAPVISITSFQYAQTELGNSGYPNYKDLVEDTDYILYPEQGKIEFLYQNFNPLIGKKRFKIIYTAGAESTPKVVQKLCTKLVAERVLSSLIFDNVNTGNDGGSISVGSISIVEPASYGVSSYKQLKSDIDKLKEDITGGFGVYRYYG